MADACQIMDQEIPGVTFEEAKEAYGKQSYWVSFFVRPCCPPPGAETAKVQLEKQRQMVCDRADFSPEQQAELIELINKGEAWYKSTPYWHKG